MEATVPVPAPQVHKAQNPSPVRWIQHQPSSPTRPVVRLKSPHLLCYPVSLASTFTSPLTVIVTCLYSWFIHNCLKKCTVLRSTWPNHTSSQMFLSFRLEYLEAWSQFSAFKQKVDGIVESSLLMQRREKLSSVWLVPWGLCCAFVRTSRKCMPLADIQNAKL